VGLKPEESRPFVTDLDFENVSDLKKGDDIFYLGFPLAYGSYHGSNPMVRKGIVALKEEKDDFFYIDATVAPGNSGGPVFRIGKESKNEAYTFLGIVSAFRPFERDGFLFHAGMGVVYPVDSIKELLESKEFKATY
jgi:S1-C subfamily serine protease